MVIGIKNFLCQWGWVCGASFNRQNKSWNRFLTGCSCVCVCDFSLDMEHVTLPFCMLRHVYVNPTSMQKPSVVQPRWQRLEFSNESLLFPVPREKPSLRSVSDLWVLVEKLWASATRSFRLALKQSRNKNSKVLCIIDFRVALLLQETGLFRRGCSFSPLFAVISEITKTAKKWGNAAESGLESGLLLLTALKHLHCPQDKCW